MKTSLQKILSQLPATADIHQTQYDQNINYQLRKARKYLYNIYRDDFLHRQQFLENKQQQHSTYDKIREAKIVGKIRDSEISPFTYKKIKAYLRPCRGNALSYIDVPHGEGYKRLTTRSDLEKALLSFHKSHFSQASSTPLASPSFLKRFGHAADTQYADNFRKGDMSELDLWPQDTPYDMLSLLRPSNDDPPPINTLISLRHIKEGFKIWRESTNTSPSGRRLSLYKIWLSKDEPTDTLTGDDFLQLIKDVINISQKLKYPLKRWKQVNNLFICKDPGVYKINRLRAIHCIDAEINLIRRELIARRLIQHAEAYNLIPNNNYGGRKGRTAIDVVMYKYLTIGIFHMQRHNCAITDCDATACYDRILPVLLSLCYHKMGLPAHGCTWLIKALTQMNYHVLTSHGCSEQTSHTDDKGTIFGIGQGATDASAGWLLISTLLSQLYEKRRMGATCSTQLAL